jgi:hypothetical protein
LTAATGAGHVSIRTAQSFQDWLAGCLRFHGDVDLDALSSEHLARVPQYLAISRRVAANNRCRAR